MYEIAIDATFADHVQVERLEKKYLPPHLVAGAALTWEWAQANPESLFILRKKTSPHEIAGHLSAFPVRKETAHLLLTGQLHDTELPAAAILPYGSDVPAALYFAILCVDEAHRPQGAYRLLSFFAAFILKKLHQPCPVDAIIAEAGSRDGQRILERRGLHKYRADDDIPCFYQAPLSELTGFFSRAAEVRRCL